MKVVFLTPGTGSWYCGACMRDHTLANALQLRGHDVLLVPMYLPLHLDDTPLGHPSALPVCFGGVNLYLDEHFQWFERSPAWLRRALDHRVVLRTASRFSNMTSSESLGEMTLAMIRMESDGMRRELDRLCEWLRREKPDVICLSTALQAGMIQSLKASTGAAILCAFQGEDGFLDNLPEGWKSACWSAMGSALTAADGRIAPSGFYANMMRSRLGEGIGPIDVLPNAVDVETFRPGLNKEGPPVIGYLARLCEAKGVDLMVDAFIRMRSAADSPAARLHIAGTMTADDKALVKRLKKQIEQAGLASDVIWSPDVSRQEKVAMLGSLSLFSVPVRVPEAFGLYVVEAMASGVPVVQPDASAFREILGDSGAGLLVPAGDANALADAWLSLLGEPVALAEMAARSRAAAELNYRDALMAERFSDFVSKLSSTPQSPGPHPCLPR